MRRLLSPPAALAAAVGLLAVFALRIAFRATAFTNDEYGMVIAGRLAARDPFDALTSSVPPYFSRGPERLMAFVQAVPDALLTSTPAELRSIHVVLALAYFATAFPAYALLRGLGAGPWTAVGFGLAAVTGPWIIFGTSLLNVTIAAPLTALFAYLAWRTAVQPS